MENSGIVLAFGKSVIGHIIPLEIGLWRSEESPNFITLLFSVRKDISRVAHLATTETLTESSWAM